VPDGLTDLAVGTALELPVSILLERMEEPVGDTDAVVGILARHRLIGFSIPVRIVFMKDEVTVALPGEVEHPLNIGFGRGIAARGGDGFPKDSVLRLIELDFRSLIVSDETSLQHRVQPLGANFRPCDHGGHFLLFHHLPFNELFNIGMVKVQADHFGGAPGRPTGFNGAGCPVTDFQEGHETG
jgi:hypothetical protein